MKSKLDKVHQIQLISAAVNAMMTGWVENDITLGLGLLALLHRQKGLFFIIHR
jgi:hypothetical protein